jgi:stage III sporulation protein SpoIIIAA
MGGMSSSVNNKQPLASSQTINHNTPLNAAISRSDEAIQLLRKQLEEARQKDGRTTAEFLADLSPEDIAALNARELQKLISVLPERYQAALKEHESGITEITAQVGRPLLTMINGEPKRILPNEPMKEPEMVFIKNKLGTPQNLETGRINLKPSLDGSGEIIEDLHRVSWASTGDLPADDKTAKTKNPLERAYNSIQNLLLTLRPGRAFVKQDLKLVNDLRDYAEHGKSIILLGPPGAGKTSLLRALIEAVSQKKRVVVIEGRANEIGGASPQPHSVLGNSVIRMSVPPGGDYETVVKQAVENHGAQIIVFDEVDYKVQEAIAAALNKGVTGILTSHASSLGEFVTNKQLSGISGGADRVTVGDEFAAENNGAKEVAVREGETQIRVAVILRQDGTKIVHPKYTQSVDELMQGKQPTEVSLYSGKHGERYNFKQHGEDITRFQHAGSVMRHKNNAKGKDKIGVEGSTRPSQEGSQKPEQVYKGADTRRRQKARNADEQRAKENKEISDIIDEGKLTENQK